MNKTIFIWGLVIALLVGGFAGSLLVKNGALGSVTPYYSMNNAALVAELNVLAAPLIGIGNGTTAAIAFPTLTDASATTTAETTSTTVTGVGASLGDVVLVSANTPTAGIEYVGHVATASTTSATFAISAINVAGASTAISATTFNVIVLPASTFKGITVL